MTAETMTRCRTILVAGALALLAGAVARADVYDDVVKYEWAQPRTPLATIEQEARDAATPAARAAIETKLLKALADPGATYECKQFVCRMLRRMGSPACVPALAKLLADEKLSHMARFALQDLPGDEAGAALRDAMDKLSGKLRVGVITSLGERRDAKAVPALAKLASGADVELAHAAIGALGRIATADAAKALAGAKVPDSLKNKATDACLVCADRMLDAGDAAAAAAIYTKTFAEAGPKPLRIAALRGMVLADGEKAAATLIGLLKDKDADLRRAATKFLVEMPGPGAAQVIAAKLAAVSTAEQAMLIDVLTQRGDAAAAAAVTQLVDSKDEPVRLAAVKALAVLGDASSVPVLVKTAAAGGPLGDAATKSLNELKGEGVGEAIGKLLDSPDAVVRAGAIGVLTARGDRSMCGEMLKAARDPDEKIRMAAIEGVGALGGCQVLPGIVSLLVASKPGAERDALDRAVTAVAGRVDEGERDVAAAAVAAGLAKADADAKVRLLTVLGRTGGPKALEAVRGQVGAADADVATSAVRALAAWPDAAPADDLLKVIKTTSNNTQKVLAFRGYIRMANLSAGRSAGETTRMYEQALALATNAAEKKSVLAGLAGARSAEALKLVESLVADDALKAEAELAVVQVAGNARDAAPDEARAALKKIVASTKRDDLRQKARATLAEMDKFAGYVTSWLGSGPYTAGNLFDTAYPPEAKDSRDVKWHLLAKGIGPQKIDLEQAIAKGGNRAGYLKTSIWSPADQDVRLDIGSDDGVRVWINGKLVHSNNATRPCTPGQDKVKTRLKKGWNAVLVKVTQGGGEWELSFRVAAPDGTALEGMKVSVEGR